MTRFDFFFFLIAATLVVSLPEELFSVAGSSSTDLFPSDISSDAESSFLDIKNNDDLFADSTADLTTDFTTSGLDGLEDFSLELLASYPSPKWTNDVESARTRRSLHTEQLTYFH